MNEYDDLFERKTPVDTPINPIPTDDDWDTILHEQKANRWLISLYFAVQVLFVFIIMMVNTVTYPNSQVLYDNLQTTNPIQFDIQPSEDPEYPYLVSLQGSLLNQNSEAIDLLMINIDFYYQGEYIDYYSIPIEPFDSNATYTVNDSLYFTTPIDEIEYTYSFELDSNMQMILNISQSFLMAASFLFIDRVNFKKRWKEFRQNAGESVGKIVLGLAMVYMASLIGQGIVMALGGSPSSANEDAIASLFTADPLRLVSLFFMLCILAPLTEEVIYRKVIFGWLDQKWGSVTAIILSGAIFGLMHVISYGDFIQSIPYILMGATFGYLYHWARNNIFVTITVHFLNNLIAYVMYFLLIMGFVAV